MRLNARDYFLEPMRGLITCTACTVRHDACRVNQSEPGSIGIGVCLSISVICHLSHNAFLSQRER